MERIRKKYQMKKLYHIHNDDMDPFKDCDKCDGYRTVVKFPSNPFILWCCWCNIEKYITVYNCPYCKGTGKIKK